MGNDFLVASYDKDFENMLSYAKEHDLKLLLISPSTMADFKVDIYDKGVKSNSNSLPAAIASGAYLICKKGLPLDEIVIETDDGSIQIFNTDGILSLLFVAKSKRMFTQKSAFVKGCEIEYSDIDISQIVRIIEVENFSGFDKKVLPSFSFLSTEHLPSAVVFAKISENKIEAASYTDFSFSPASRLTIAAALSSYCQRRMGLKKEIVVDGFSCNAMFGSTGVLLQVVPEIN